MRKDITLHYTVVFILSTLTKKSLIVQGRKTVKFVIVAGIKQSASITLNEKHDESIHKLFETLTDVGGNYK